MVMEIIREGLIITPTGSLEPSQGSYNVPVKLINDETYPNYTINMYIGYYINGAMKKIKCETDSEGHYLIPGIAFLRSGIISISFLLESTDKSQGLMTNALSYEIKHAPNVVVEVPADPTWQELVKEWIQELAGAVNVDNTLTKSGMAADAKATGDAISKLSDEKANKTYVDEQIAKAQLEGAGIDTSQFVTQSDLKNINAGWTHTQISLFETLLSNFAYNDETTGQNIAKSLIASLRENTSSDDSGSEDSGGEETPTEKTLSNISVVYTGGNVAVGTDINSLSGIVVTATYDNGTYSNVTDYTLSGEIVEGTNTITVSYGGMTTTFEVVGYVESTDEEWTVVQEIGDNYESGALDLSTGELTENTSWYTSSFIEVPSGSTSFSRITSRTTDYYLSWYDENQTFIGNGLNGTYSGVSTYGGGYTDEEGIIWNVIPSEAKYCKVSWRTSATYTSLTFKHNLLLNENITPVQNKLYYYTTNPNNPNYVDLILIDDYLCCKDMAYAQIRPILRRHLSFYDVNHSLLSEVAVANNTGNNVEIPSDAVYMRFVTTTMANASSSSATRTGYGLIKFTETELTTW